jgi:hypothetical protein
MTGKDLAATGRDRAATGRDLATNLATRLAGAVPERAMDALPSLPQMPWQRRRTSLPVGFGIFGLGLALGIGLGFLLSAGVETGADDEASARADGGAEAEHPGGNPIQ